MELRYINLFLLPLVLGRKLGKNYKRLGIQENKLKSMMTNWSFPLFLIPKISMKYRTCMRSLCSFSQSSTWTRLRTSNPEGERPIGTEGAVSTGAAPCQHSELANLNHM